MFPISSPSARMNHAMASLGDDQVLLFGGDDGTYDGETWVYDLSANTWTQMFPISSPSARWRLAMAFLGSDQVLLFGGNDGTYDGETWVYDLSANTWTQMFPISSPSARQNHAMVYMGDDQVLLFGGHDGDYDAETWVYDLSVNAWTQMSPSASPSARYAHAMVSLEGGQVLLFGGLDASGQNDETWVYGDLTPPDAIDDVAIAVENLTKGGDIRLTWSAPGDDIGVSRYIIYRSTSASSSGDSIAGTTDTTYLDTGAIGDPDSNYCYTVRAADAASNTSDQSNQVGEHDVQLATTTGTDYTWLSLCLGDSNLVMASDLEADIEAHSSPATNCLTVSEWNPTAQTYTHYTTVPIPMGDFPLTPGSAYRVEVTSGAVWTLVGDVLASDSVSFQLQTTTGTDYTWLSLPLHLDSLAMASDLEAHIQSHSSPATDCLTISEWNPTAQTYTHYTTVPIPMGDFSIRPGRAYRVEVTSNAEWPDSGKGSGQLQRARHTR